MSVNRLFVFILLLTGIANSPPAEAAKATPNVVLIISDDQAWFDFGFMGSDDIQTPHLDRLAEQSAVFTRGYVPTSVCRPSLASIITGRYPHEHLMGVGIGGLKSGGPETRKRFLASPPLPTLLDQQNYRSLQTGKWWEGDFRHAGFTHGMTTGTPIAGSTLTAAGPWGSVRIDRGLLFLAGGEGLRIGREGIDPIRDFVKNRGDQPFFLWYAPMMPHTPHNPPERILQKYQQKNRSPQVARYMAMCEWFDESCGELLTVLDDEGIADNTIVLFLTDNGYVPVANIDWFSKRSKLSPFDDGLRTPVMLRWPERVRPQRDETTPVSAIDIAPTILAACDVPVPSELTGLNLLDLCDGASADRDTVFGATYRFRSDNPLEPTDTVDYRWCVSGQWKLIVPRETDRPRQLYDILADPREASNLAKTHPKTADLLQSKLDAWWPTAKHGKPE